MDAPRSAGGGMIIVCPTCDSRYLLGAGDVGPEGRAVRCTRCRTEWRVFADSREPAMAAEGVGGRSAPGSGDRFDLMANADNDAGDVLGAFDIDATAEPDPMAAVAPAEPRRRPLSSRKPKPKKPKGPRFWTMPRLAIAAGLVAIAGLGLFRQAVVRVAPATASLYAHLGLPVNLRGLDISGVTTRVGSEGGVPVLIVEGLIGNVTQKPVVVPRLRLAVRDEKQSELYNWTAVVSRDALPPGETLAFKTRLAAPPAEGRAVVVRFLGRRDMVVGTR